MASSPLPGIPIRLQLSTASAPPVPPFDINTGQPPAQWRSNAVSYQVGIFDAYGNPVNLANLAYLQLSVAVNQTAPANLIVSTVLAGGIIPLIDQAGWLNGTAQNASFNLSAAQCDVAMQAQPSQALWLQVAGVTTSGAIIVYGAGYVTFYNAGSATPAPPPLITDFNAQPSAATGGAITALTCLHTEQITVTGAAGTRLFLVNPGLTYAGCWVYVVVLLPTTPGIIIQLAGVNASSNILAEIISDGYSRAAFISLYFDGQYYWPGQVIVPAFTGTTSPPPTGRTGYPLVVPGVTDYNAQTSVAGNGGIAALTQIHTEQLTVAGAAGVRNFAVNPGNTYAGAWVYVAIALPSTAGITVNFLNLNLTGNTVASILTDGFVSVAFVALYFDGVNYNPGQVLVQ